MDQSADSFREDNGSGLHYELRFDSLFDIGRAFRFPCDPLGRVALEALSPRQRQSLERVMDRVGRDYASPQLVALAG
jgi:hypothetical protein